MKKQMLFKAFAILCILSMLAACAPAGTPTVAPADTSAPATAAVVAPADTSVPATAAPATVAPATAPVTLTVLSSPNQTDQDMINALMEAYKALHPNVTFKVEIGVAGTEGDNLVKTRLATGEMSDIFYYNSGSLLQALNPSEMLVDLANEPFMSNVSDSFKPAVSQNGGVFGVPVGPAAGGGIMYNKAAFAKAGISVPKTWAEFEANNEKLKAAGITPVLQTYGDTWTAQLFVLADNYNVVQALPTYAADYTANKVKIADTPAAMAGFSHLEEGFQKGWYNKDFKTAKFDASLKLLADGSVAQYPMLTFIASTINANWPDKTNDIGFFAMPGVDAAHNGATIWLPLSFYIPKTTKNIDAAKDFLAFVASTAGTDALAAKVLPTGPYLIKGAKLPANVLPFVNELNAYIDSGNAYPALEFVSPIKGPNLEQICVAVGTGQTTAAAGAAAYDKDVEKQAKQLGLPGW